MNLLITPAIIENDIERSTDGNDHLLTSAMGMATSSFTRRNIIGPIDTSDVERHILHLLGHRQVATRVHYFGEFYDSSYHFFK